MIWSWGLSRVLRITFNPCGTDSHDYVFSGKSGIELFIYGSRYILSYISESGVVHITVKLYRFYLVKDLYYSIFTAAGVGKFVAS